MSIQVWFATLIWAGVMGLAFTASAYMKSTLKRRFEALLDMGMAAVSIYLLYDLNYGSMALN